MRGSAWLLLVILGLYLLGGMHACMHLGGIRGAGNDGRSVVSATHTMQKPSKSWVFTLNNPLPEEYDVLERWSVDDTIRRLIVSEEFGELGTLHWQGGVTFARAYRKSQLIKLLKRAYFDQAKVEDFHLYCCKDESYVFFDVTNRKQGKEGANTKEIIDLVKSGASNVEIIDQHESAFHFQHALDKYRASLRFTKRGLNDPPPEVLWLYGSTGIGKTRYAYEIDAELDSISFSDSRFVLGYRGAPTVLIDDFRRGQYPFSSLLRLLDRYPIQVDVKGSSVDWSPKRIIITCPYRPEDEFAGEDESIDQLLRRITDVKGPEFFLDHFSSGTSQDLTVEE